MDELTIRWPDAGLEHVESAKQRLSKAGAWLRACPEDQCYTHDVTIISV